MKQLLFNKALRVLLITNALVLVAAAMLGPIYALFVEKVGGDLLDASITGGIFALAAGITTLLAGKYADKIKHDERIVSFGYFFMGVGFFMYLFVSSIWFLFIVQVVIGFGEAIYAPAFDLLYTKHVCKTKMGSEWGTWEAMNYITLAIGAVVGGVIVTTFGFNAIFVIMGLLCVSSAAYICFVPKGIL